MIDRSIIGRARPERSIRVELVALRAFAAAIGEANPVFSDDAAARAAGYRGAIAPPTFLFCLGTLADDDPSAFLRDLGLSIDRLLHGEQAFCFDRPIVAGDLLRFNGRISDVSQRGGGRFDLVIEETVVTDEAGERVATMATTFVVPN